MLAFRQVIFPGDVGADVLAVKHALRRMGIKGSGAMNSSRRAGEAFVDARWDAALDAGSGFLVRHGNCPTFLCGRCAPILG